MIEERNEKKGVAPYLLLLLLTTVLWGIGFVVTEQLTQNNVPVFMLFAIQFAIGAFCLAWFAFFGKKAERKPPSAGEAINGLLLGLLLGAALVLKHFGLDSYSQGMDKSYFFSSAFVLFVPVLVCVFEKRWALKELIDGLIALTGLALFYNMFHKSDFFFSLFDGLSLMGGIAFAFYYYLLGRYANRFDTARWVFYQLATVAVVCSAFTLIFEMKYMSEIKNGMEVAFGLIYLGVFCTGLAYFILVLAQKRLPSPSVSLVVGGQSVFAFLFAWAMGYVALESASTVVGTVIIIVAALSSLAVRPEKFYLSFGRIFRIAKYSEEKTCEKNSVEDVKEKDSASDG